MKLKRLKIENFRGYNSEKTIDFLDDFNVIIGKNDVGKSTVLDALDIFFNDSKMDIGDLNINCDKNNSFIAFTCVFEVNEDDTDIIIDSSKTINLKKEYLLNKNNELEIRKEFTVKDSKISSSSKKILIANYPTEYKTAPLVIQKIDSLKKILASKQESISNYESINKTISSEIRLALYEIISQEFEEIPIDMSKEDMKCISEKLFSYLPLYFLFKSDRENTDKDEEVQNPLKIATKEYIKELEEEFNALQEKVEKYIKEVGKKTIEKFKEMSEELNVNLETNLELKPWESVFNFTIVGDDNIPLNKRGSGFRRLILLSYFRAESERILKDGNSKNIIYAIEEPETSQHPDFQVMVIETLKSIAESPRYNVLITTHTPEIIRLVDSNNIILLEKNSDNELNIYSGDNLDINKIINTLGVLPFAKQDIVMCVEGQNDVSFLKSIGKIDELKNIYDINSISIIPMVGSNLMKWLKENYFKNSNIKELHLYDNDINEYKEEVDRINAIQDGRRYGIITSRPEIENYIPVNYVEEYFNLQIPANIKEQWHILDIPNYLKTKVKLDITNESERVKVIKGILNKSISAKIKYSDLVEDGSKAEIESWFQKLNELYNN